MHLCRSLLWCFTNGPFIGGLLTVGSAGAHDMGWLGAVILLLGLAGPALPAPCGRAIPGAALQPFQGWPTLRITGLWLSSAPLGTRRHAPMQASILVLYQWTIYRSFLTTGLQGCAAMGGHGLPEVPPWISGTGPDMPCRRATSRATLRPCRGWPAWRAGGLRPSSASVDPLRRTPVQACTLGS
jgi:hypothetical protein